MQHEVDPALFNMVEQQIRPWEVLDQKILDTLFAIPRVQFVPAPSRALAYADTEIDLGHGQCMMTPKMEGRMLQSLELKPSDIALEVGSGSGYVTALLARLCKHVYSVDIYPDFVESSEKKLQLMNIQNTTLEVGDAAQGWSHHAPYDVIAVMGSLPDSAQPFKEHLKVNGRLFAVIGCAPVMRATLIRRVGLNLWSEEVLFETVLAPLINAVQPNKFVF